MPRMFTTSDARKYASRVGLMKGRGAKINGRPAHIVVAEREKSKEKNDG